MAIGISTAYGRWRNEQKAAGRRPEDGVTALFVLGKRGRERRIGWREWAQGWRLAEDDRRQRCAGLVGSWARMGERSAIFNRWLNTMPVTAGLCCAYCVRTASVRRRVDGQSGSARPRIGGNAGRPCDCSGRQRGSAQVGVGNSAKAIREPGLFRWSGSAVRCPGGQAVFDGAVFTAKGEG